jgi:hypothetical protein
MTPLLLTLANLTPGDGGPGGGAAGEPVAVKLGEGFTGYIRPPGGPLCPVRLGGGGLGRAAVGQCDLFPASLTLDAEGRFRLEWGRAAFKGTVRRGGGRTVLTLDRPITRPEPRQWRRLAMELGTASRR